MRTILTILVLGLFSIVEAVPRFALMEDVTCSSCHSYQGGGGARNSYGKEYVSESLVMNAIQLPWSDPESEFPVQFGMDMRYQMVQRDSLRHFPMQFALYSGIELENIIAHVEISRLPDEYRLTGGIRYEGLPLDAWVFLGKELPTPGWRMDDHTLLIRGGNLTRIGLPYEGMPYSPYMVAPEMLELGFTAPLGLEFVFSAGSPFIDPFADSTNYFSMLKLAQSLYLGPLSARYSTSYLIEGEISAWTVSYGVTLDQLTYLGEYVEYRDWIEGYGVTLASLNQLSYRVLPGIDALVRYEFFDLGRKYRTGAMTRWGTGVEFFPIPGIELKLGYQSNQLQFADGTKTSQGQLLGQIHLYY